MSADKDKIIIRRESLPGVDKSIYDYSYAHSVPVVWTKVTISAYKTFNRGYIGLKDNIRVGEIIQPNNTNSTYKIMKVERVTEKGNLYKIARTDGYPLVAVDLDNLIVGRKIKIITRIGIRDGMFDK